MSSIDPRLLVDPECYGKYGYPHSAWTQLRREAPVCRFELAGWPDFWALSKHQHIVEVSKQPNLFLNAPGMTFAPNPTREGDGQATIRTIINMDPPEHREFRKVAAPYFTPRAVNALEELVVMTARGLIDDLGEEGECDFITEVASLHPLKVIGFIRQPDSSPIRWSTTTRCSACSANTLRSCPNPTRG